MIPEKMKSKLTEELEFWNAGLIQELKSFKRETAMFNLITARMQGMICFALSIGIITDEEKAELYYIYFNEED